MIQNNLPKLTNFDSSEEVRNFFDRYYQKEVTFPVQQIDAVVGYFLKRGFDEISAKSISILLLNQARVDNVNVFQLVDTLKGLTDVQLSAIVTEILNTYREKTSTLGFKKQVEELTTESRNIRV
jgi:S-adenosylmethionine:diacylglycerol 3-amino-3-carboxypropyl transferase